MNAGIADLDFGMSDAPVWASHPHSLCSPERRFVKFNRGGAVPDDEIGLQRVVGMGNGLCSGHRVLLNAQLFARRGESRICKKLTRSESLQDWDVVQVLGGACQVLAWREPRKLPKIVDEIGLVVVSAVQCHLNPVNLPQTMYRLQYALESAYTTESFRC